MLKKGDRVFFAENSKDSGVMEGQFGAVFYRVAGEELGFDAVFYMGVGLGVRESSLDKEIRDAFYSAQACVLYFGQPKDGSSNEDHWVLPELKHAMQRRMGCLIYVAPTFPPDVLQIAGYSGSTHTVRSANEFEDALRRDLENLLREEE